MNILLPSDVFPPKAGGAGWSAHALALALQERGHLVSAIVPRQGRRGTSQGEVLGVPVVCWGYTAPAIPFVKNYFRHERLWQPLAQVIAACAPANNQPTIIHAQHVQVAPAAVLAGRQIGAPVVVTVRDHWPWDYFATGLHADRLPLPHQNWATLATDLLARQGPLRGAPALLALPYMLAHMRRRQAFLRQADAVVAVSQYIANRLTPIVPAARLHVLPNMVDLAAIDRVIATPPQSIAPGQPYLLFAGKLEWNKGAGLLGEVFRAIRGQEEARHLSSSVPATAGGLPTLVICGDGPLRPQLEHELAALGVPVHFLAWAEHDEVLRLMAHCELLLFPSAWGDPLSRVLLEACACGAPILAMPTGGTPDVIREGQSGALAATTGQFAARMAELLASPAARQALADGARRRAETHFSTTQVVPGVEALYRELSGKG